jgi:hypothetical protein
MSKNTGYGRGWQEPKAETKIGRLLQRLREPATTTDYVALLAIWAVGITLLLSTA